MGEEFPESPLGDAVAGGSVEVTHQFVQGLLGVAEGALGVRVVSAPTYVPPSHGGDRRYRGAVVLEGGVPLACTYSLGIFDSLGRTAAEC